MSTQTTSDMVLEKLLAHTNDGLFVLDNQRRYILFNPACERLTGYSMQEVQGCSCRCMEVTDCEDAQGRSLAGQLCPGIKVFSGEVADAKQRMKITTRAGEERWIETLYTPVRNAAGQPELVIGVMRDVSDQHEREQDWRKTTENLRQEVELLRQHMRERYGFAGIISRSPRMQVVIEKVHAACGTTSPVLIVGEDGTGKEMIARIIHFNGLQKNAPFVPMSCSGISREMVDGELFGYARGSFAGASQDYPGLYCAADNGTLFLDDVAALPESTQAKLLRAMQDRAVRPVGSITQTPANVRLIAATHRPPQELITSKTLRDDLYYRLSVISIELPPLRQRKEDIPFLVEHFLGQFNRQATRQVDSIEPAAWPILENHEWPGNVRELQNVLEAAFVGGSGKIILASELQAAMQSRLRTESMGSAGTGPVELDDTLAEVERRTILAALRRANGQRSHAAKLMGISRSRLYRRMDALGIAPRKEGL